MPALLAMVILLETISFSVHRKARPRWSETLSSLGVSPRGKISHLPGLTESRPTSGLLLHMEIFGEPAQVPFVTIEDVTRFLDPVKLSRINDQFGRHA